MIFYQLNIKPETAPAAIVNNVFKAGSTVKEKIDMAVFPALQGGPHNHQIGALAVQLKEVATPEFKTYAAHVVKNCKALGEHLKARCCTLVSGGTDTHLLLVDCAQSFGGVNGRKVERVCELGGLTLNKNTIPGDVNALSPSGVRIGLCAMTTRGCTEADMEIIADFLVRAGKIAEAVQIEKGKKYTAFEEKLGEREDILTLKKEVSEWASSFYYPGV